MSDANRNIFLYDSKGRMIMLETCESRKSPRLPDGSLKLRANPHKFIHRKVVSRSGGPDYLWKSVNGVNYPAIKSDQTYLKAYNSFNKKLHGGDASLGVTLGSWRQSAAMVEKRLGHAHTALMRVRTRSQAIDMVRELKRQPSGKDGTFVRASANGYLEGIFGWAPLFGDIHSAMEVVTGPVVPVFVSGQGRDYVESSYNNGGQASQPVKAYFTRRSRLSAIVRIDNPNLWLANRLGLVNPAVVAWDLIPWSFVVGMFVNVTQILRSFTDWVGLEFTDYSETNSLVGYQEHWVYPSYPLKNDPAYTRIVYREKERVLRQQPRRPPLAFRIPDLTWSTALMAASLAVQQSTRVLKLLPRNYRTYTE